MPLSPGTSLGPYQIDAPLGAGGMGEVYKATDTRLDRTVAIKVLPEHVAADPDLKQRFEREAKTISSLNHPHIGTLYDIGSQDGIDFLVMEHLEGETLAQRLEKGALPLAEQKTDDRRSGRELRSVSPASVDYFKCRRRNWPSSSKACFDSGDSGSKRYSACDNPS